MKTRRQIVSVIVEHLDLHLKKMGYNWTAPCESFANNLSSEDLDKECDDSIAMSAVTSVLATIKSDAIAKIKEIKDKQDMLYSAFVNMQFYLAVMNISELSVLNQIFKPEFKVLKMGEH